MHIPMLEDRRFILVGAAVFAVVVLAVRKPSAAEGVASISASFQGFGDAVSVTVGVCPADLDDDGMVRAFDLAILLGNWDPSPPGAPDFDGDGDVDASDLAFLLRNWGPCP